VVGGCVELVDIDEVVVNPKVVDASVMELLLLLLLEVKILVVLLLLEVKFTTDSQQLNLSQ